MDKQRLEIMNKIKLALQAIRVHGKGYMEYSSLWIWDKNIYLSEVKKFGRNLSLDERDAEADQEGSSLVKPLGMENPPLSVYKEQLDKFIELQDQIRTWDTHEDFFVFLRLNMTGFKAAVLNQVGQWISLFKMDLINRVKNSLKVRKLLSFKDR